MEATNTGRFEILAQKRSSLYKMEEKQHYYIYNIYIKIYNSEAGNYPEESIQHSKQGESLKSKTLIYLTKQTDRQRGAVSYLTLQMAAIGKAWSLRGWTGHDQTLLHIFVQQLLCWEFIRSFTNCGRQICAFPFTSSFSTPTPNN